MFRRIITLIFVGIGFLIILLGMFKVIPEYMGNHTYYYNMLKSGLVWRVMITNFLISILASIILFLIFNSSVRNKILWAISTLYIMVFIFGIFYIGFKGEIIGSGGFIWFINSFFMFGMMIIFLNLLLLLGTLIKQKSFKLFTVDIFGVVTNFGLGLAIFLLINYILILLKLVYPIVSWFLLFLGIILIYSMRNYLKVNFEILENILKNTSSYKSRFIYIFVLILLSFSLMYFNYGFLMSWIPYPTAWDANHAYMFFPKMWSFHHGFYWDEHNMNTTPYLWLGYITFWFSLFIPFYDKFWISPDTWAVEMNFLSGMFVLIFGLALLWEILNILERIYMESRKNVENKYGNLKENLFLVGWFLILLWLTSGMGAFLVFVDNKTDLGVLSLIILAIYGGFLAFRKVIENKDNLKIKKGTKKVIFQSKFSETFNVIIYLILSAFFFAIAVASKPTAFFDVVNFAGFVSMYFLGIFVGIFIFLAAIFVLGYLQFRGIKNYFTKDVSILLFGKPAILTGVSGIFEVIIRKSFKYIHYLFIWGIAFVIFLVMIKGVWLIGELIYYPDRFRTVKDIFMILFFG